MPAPAPRRRYSGDDQEPAGEAIGLDISPPELAAGLAAMLASELAAAEAAGEDSGAAVSLDFVQAAVANIMESRARNRTFRMASSVDRASAQVKRTDSPIA